MLVLTRKANQSIMIGDGIEVSVLSVMGEKVRIDRKSTRLNSSHIQKSRMPSSA